MLGDFSIYPPVQCARGRGGAFEYRALLFRPVKPLPGRRAAGLREQAADDMARYMRDRVRQLGGGIRLCLALLCLRALASQFRETRANGLEIIGGANALHVSSVR